MLNELKNPKPVIGTGNVPTTEKEPLSKKKIGDIIDIIKEGKKIRENAINENST